MQQQKRGPGRPRLDPAGVQKSRIVKLTPAESSWLSDTYGSVNRGVRKLVTAALLAPDPAAPPEPPKSKRRRPPPLVRKRQPRPPS